MVILILTGLNSRVFYEFIVFKTVEARINLEIRYFFNKRNPLNPAFIISSPTALERIATGKELTYS